MNYLIKPFFNSHPFAPFVALSTVIHVLIFITVPINTIQTPFSPPELFDIDLMQLQPLIKKQEVSKLTMQPPVIKKQKAVQKKNRAVKKRKRTEKYFPETKKEATVSLFETTRKKSKYSSCSLLIITQSSPKPSRTLRLPLAGKTIIASGILTCGPCLRLTVQQNGTRVSLVNP